MKDRLYHFSVQIYYEDTDHSGAVYHPNFLKYFERAREHVLGIENLARLWNKNGLGFAVYKVEIMFHEAVEYGDVIDIRTQFDIDGEYRVNWHQEAWKNNASRAAVVADLQHVCLNRDRQLMPIPLLASES